MPCNPSVGGIGKAQLVFEIDALGGEMAQNTDYTGIQFRTLNTRRGPAVQSNRVQCDRAKYSARMISILATTRGLSVIEGEAVDLLVERNAIRGVVLQEGTPIRSKAVVLATGTALGGVMHVGSKSWSGGGNGDPAASHLSRSLKSHGFTLARLKTGTPPRLARESIDLDRMDLQVGDDPPPFMSWMARCEYSAMIRRDGQQASNDSAPMFHVEHHQDQMRPWPLTSQQLPCYLTRTNHVTHSIVREHIKESSMYGGFITGTGVRYCPSLEDKVVKFPEMEDHHVFIEPEGRDSDVVYPNGISNSLPESVQDDLVHSIAGLERATIARYGFAIEYDYSDPTQLTSTLESRSIDGLFLAGQINGTTGYEEAAAQGFMAGVNASRKAMGLTAIIMSREDGYIGVLIDDLVTKGTSEPYRMFTSRAERRLILRQDNARYRMLAIAKSIGIASRDFMAETDQFSQEIAAEISRLNSERHDGVLLSQILKRPEVRYDGLPSANGSLHQDVKSQVEILMKYEGYIRREEHDLKISREWDGVVIPDNIDYHSIRSIRKEAQEKLSKIRPRTLGQALRIPGITPADIAMISLSVRH